MRKKTPAILCYFSTSFQRPSNNAHSAQPLTHLLKKCGTAEELKIMHAAMIKTSADQDCFAVNQFAAACARLHRMDYVHAIFSRMLAPNVYVYNAVIGGYVHCCMPAEALRLYLDMARSSIRPTSYTYSSLAKACTQLSALRLGQSMHARILRVGFGSQVFVQTGLVDFYSSLSRIKESKKLFDEMRVRDVVAWTTMMSGYTCVGDMDSAWRIFEAMPERSTVSWNIMIAGFARLGDVQAAASLFDQMHDRDSVSWTTMISCYSQNRRFREAVEAFEAMKAVEVCIDEVTLATVISACAHLGALNVGKEVHHFAMAQGFDLDVYIGSALIDMYAKCGSIERSLMIFFKLKEKNLFCWNSIIEGLAIHGRSKEALQMFSRMKRHKIEPNEVSFVSVLSACTHAGLIKEGRRMFSSMINDHMITPTLEHYGCMVDLLSRAGLLQEALELIRSMEMEPNSVIWGAVLGGCKLHGDLEIAEVAVKKLSALEPRNSGHHMLLVNLYAEASKWGEIAAMRSLMKERRVEKKNPGCSWIEMDGVIHEFAASPVSHPCFSKISVLLFRLDAQLRLAGYTPA